MNKKQQIIEILCQTIVFNNNRDVAEQVADQILALDDLIPVDEIRDLLYAVGHVGVDFGEGEYQLSTDQIKKAQELYAALEPPTKEE